MTDSKNEKNSIRPPLEQDVEEDPRAPRDCFRCARVPCRDSHVEIN